MVCEHFVKRAIIFGLFFALSIPNALSNQIEPRKTVSKCQQINFQDWLKQVKICSDKYGVDPYFALAVAEVESSNKEVRFRFGKMGKGTYYGPFGIHKCFLKKWTINDPMVNTEVGIRALARYTDQRKSLRKYNLAFHEGYFKRIKQLEARNRKDGVFDFLNSRSLH